MNWFGGNKNSISMQEAYEIMDKKDQDFVLLDVRTPAEFKNARLEGAKLIPVDEISARAKLELPNKDILILVYCHSGARAASAVKQLTSMGYTNVFNFGGIVNWPYKIIRD